jgi:PAS domain S-box-containing protein
MASKPTYEELEQRVKELEEEAAERKLVEEALRDSEERYHAIFEQAADSIVLIDGETGALVEFNERAHDSLGFIREEFEKLKIPDFEVIESAEQVEKHIKKIIDQGTDTFETKHRTKGGEIRDIQVTSRNISIRGKNFVQSMWRDVTELKRVEKALRESEEFSSSLLTNSPNPILVINPDSCVRYVNPSLENLTGFSSLELIGRKAPYPWWTEETLEKTSRDLEEAMVKGAQKLEELFQKKDGEQFWVEITSAPVRSNGEIEYYLANWVDITERKQAQEVMRKSEERYRRITETVTDYIFTVRIEDGHPMETVHGPACVAVTGYASDEFAYDPYLWIRMVYEEDRAAVEEQAKRVLLGQDVQPIEHRILRKDGVMRWVRNTPVPNFDGLGRLLSYDGLIQDITERKEADEALCKANEKLYKFSQELERKVQERTAELEERSKQLVEAERLAAMGKMADRIAHELRNSLIVVGGFARRVNEKTPDDDPNKKYLRTIVGEVMLLENKVSEIIKVDPQ